MIPADHNVIARDGGPEGLPLLRWAPSPNHYGWTLHPRGIVVHETEGPYRSAVAWFGTPASQVSAHVVLAEDGSEATQCVPWLLPAWHAVNANDHTIGIELAGYTAKPNAPRQIARAARIVGYLCTRYGIPARQADAHGFGGICRHRDLGAYGGGHQDPGGFNWTAFLVACETEVRRGGYRPSWGREH